MYCIKQMQSSLALPTIMKEWAQLLSTKLSVSSDVFQLQYLHYIAINTATLTVSILTNHLIAID